MSKKKQIEQVLTETHDDQVVTVSGNFNPTTVKKAFDKHIKPMEKPIEKGYPIHYVRFHQPVPPAKDKEPVSEFRLQSKDTKYMVGSMHWTPEGVIYKAYGETGMVPLANIVYCRLTL